MVFIAVVLPLAAQRRPERYALLLNDAPVSQSIASRSELLSTRAVAHRDRVLAAQAKVRQAAEQQSFQVVGAVHQVLNAVFVQTTAEHEADLQALPGVQRVVRLGRRYPLLDRAVQTINAPGAWATLGGIGSAGAGMKIGILDSGIEVEHPMFRDPALPMPAGYPKCNGADCAFTSNKIIVARSYVGLIAAGSDPRNPALDSRPDDLSPRDRVGHGTAVASVAAGNQVNAPLATIAGVAPKAYLGNYKIFGTPGVNDGASDDAIITAIEDAYSDGMDVISLSLGGPSFFGPLDQGGACGLNGTTPCDVEAAAIENVTRAGVLVVASVGNEGDTGDQVPTLSTVDSPGIAPSALAVGAITNSHQFVNSLRVIGGPGTLAQVDAVFGDGPRLTAPVSAPAVDVGTVSRSKQACAALPANSLTGVFALIDLDGCFFSTKVLNAQAAGAVGVILYLTDAEPIFAPGGLTSTQIPAVVIGQTDARTLLSYAAANPRQLVSLDPALRAEEVSAAGEVASFSSQGPATGSGAIKPELVAVGTEIYMAAERGDTYGELYSADGYGAASGTSFSAPMAAGAAALVKQRSPRLTPGQIKSALVNTASSDVRDQTGALAQVTAIGAGRLNVAAAVSATVAVEPSTLSFGIVRSGALPLQQTLQISNTGTGSVTLSLSLSARSRDNLAQVALDRTGLTLGPGQSAPVRVSLTGSTPTAGTYEGSLTIQGGGTTLRVPYLYLVGSGAAYNIIPLTGYDFDATVGEQISDGFVSFKIVDRYGAPVAGLPVTFSATVGNGRLADADTRTDVNGIAGATAYAGSRAGDLEFTGRAGGLTTTFTGTARVRPTISANGAVNAASFAGTVAPGSYLTLYGTGLSDSTRTASTATLPLALNEVSVSFDAPGVSVPGRVFYVSPGQVNVQVPWELQNAASAQIKVNVRDSLGTVYTLPLRQYAPALFSYATGGQTYAAAQDAGGRLITAANPARRGQTVVFYANGLGAVTNQPATGEPAPSAPLAATVVTPVIAIGGRPATVQFSGLAPGYSGLYQINAVVPGDAPSGTQVVNVAIGGVVGAAVGLIVQ